MNSKISVLLLILVFSSFAHAFQLNAEQASASKDVLRFLAEIESLLPSSIKEHLSSAITVSFVKLGDAPSLVPPCGLEKKPDQELPAYGYHSQSPFSSSDKPRIKINEKFLEEIARGPEMATSYPCGHKNLYRFAQAVVIHEIAHVLDFRSKFPYSSRFQNEVSVNLARCELGDGTQAQACAYYKGLKGRISDSREYLNTIGWTYQYGRTETKNQNTLRSPDAYESRDQHEHFAVNLEFFLLDPEFRCRRPSLYRFFEELFKHRPFAGETCSVRTNLMYNFTAHPIDLNPKRIYEIHYLLASKGDDTASSFGHSMFRIIGCAPTTPVGPACLNDITYHHVVSYRANILDMIQNNLATLVGRYPSQAFMYPFLGIIAEYTLRDSRDLLSYPLKMDAEQIERFVHQTLEFYWQYSGEYYFLSNNCATESLTLLKAVYLDKDLSANAVVSPYGLVELLQKEGLISASVVHQKDAKNRYVFPSIKSKLTELFSAVNKTLAGRASISFDEFKDSRSNQRYETYRSLVAQYPADSKLITGTWIAMEIVFRELERGKLMNKQIEILGLAKSGKYPALKNLLGERHSTNFAVQPWRTTHSGYGIPLIADQINETKMTKLIIDSERISREIDSSIEAIVPSAYSEYRAINRSLETYLSVSEN